MKKSLFIAVLAVLALASCTSDEFVGENSPNASLVNEGSIRFGGSTGNFTRATKNTGSVAEMLDGQFKVYGVKNVSSAYSDVFKDYVVFYTTTTSTSNPDGDWEYVGGTSATYGEENTGLGKEQTIKYWDYSAANYHFVAGSPVANFTYAPSDDGDIATATVTGIAGHRKTNATETALVTNPVYIAAPVNVAKDDYQKEVTFSFTRQQAYVRVGIYETIPGYCIKDIEFYYTNGANKSNYLALMSETDNYFVGGNNVTATLTYDWDASEPTYTFAYTSGLQAGKNWFGGKFTGVPATSSTHADLFAKGTDADMDANGYFTVVPTPSATVAAPLLIQCDYVLEAEDESGETIKVTGATAAIPAAFCKWAPNTSYTYLFKISDNTNGTTGASTDPAGLFPITFDAVVLAEVDGTQQGTITTVSTPSITTYQEGSVTNKGVKYKKNVPIYFTAQDEKTGALNTLSALTYGAEAVGAVQVYVVDEGTTEADLILKRPVAANKFATTVGGGVWKVNGQEVAASQWASFTPTVARTYAIEYVTATNAYAYKIVKVEE